MFRKVLLLLSVVVIIIWFAGDGLTKLKNSALGTANKESSYATSGHDGW
ncbi:hypothetical protein [Croceicoccus estronivorus]|nr:hypothetical protein [Croceicoccus estronivorus]